ncbi:MAG: HAMP domain-containing histidine kinase [Clostridia bacterium]|nr:HAMP domain-containing histidine kinase [Clostridia bacterium]
MRRPKLKFQATSIYMMVLSFIIGIMVISCLLTMAIYIFMMVFGFLVNPIFRLYSMPVMLVIIIVLLSSGMARSKLRPMNELVKGMHDVSQGDFTTRVEGEHLPGDMGELVRSFNNMTQELGSLELFRKDFINNFSHEFKTPIVSIRGFAKQLEREDLTEEQRREYISIIVSESDRLANMSTNVLLLTKLENQTIVTDKTVYRLDEQLRNCILLLEKQWTEKKLDLDLDLDEMEIRGNEEMVAHIWVNLISNAVKFSPEGGVVGVTLKNEDQMLVVRVSDQGEGMDKNTQARIFEKFFQGDSTHATEGNGLGLSLVKRIVDLCGGSIEVQSERGMGTTFTVRLPGGV